MPTESPAAHPTPPVVHLHDPDPPDDDQAGSVQSSGQHTLEHHNEDHGHQPAPNPAQQQASKALLVMGMTLFALGCAGCAVSVIGDSTMATAFVGLGLLAVVFSGCLTGLVWLELDTKLGKLLAKFKKDSTDDGPGSDDASGA
jgi:hypothetical protein